MDYMQSLYTIQYLVYKKKDMKKMGTSCEITTTRQDKHDLVFCYLVKIEYSSVRYCTRSHGISHFLQGTRIGAHLYESVCLSVCLSVMAHIQGHQEYMVAFIKGGMFFQSPGLIQFCLCFFFLLFNTQRLLSILLLQLGQHSLTSTPCTIRNITIAH